MKKVTILIVVLAFSAITNSQNKLDATGNVGIGTTKPLSALHINRGNVPKDNYPPNNHSDYHKAKDYDVLYLERGTNTKQGPSMFLKGINNQTSFSARIALLENGSANGDIAFLTSNSKNYNQKEVMRLKYNGNVGIGTTTPKDKLHVNGRLYLGTHSSGSGAWYQSMNGSTEWFAGLNDNNIWRIYKNGNKFVVNGDGKIGIGIESPRNKLHVNGRLYLGTHNSGSGTWYQSMNGNTEWFAGLNSDNIWRIYKNGDQFVVDGKGNVGIGTVKPDAKLAVNGTIHTKEVKVDLDGWSDFVFENDYKLPTLTEVENHIKTKGHLQDIPSAKEVEKNGILLGKMDAKLLQKIEELTLYTIQQEKEIKELRKHNQQQNNDIQELKVLCKQLLKK